MSADDYHAELQELRSELERLRGLTRPTIVSEDKPRPLRQSEILRAMLERDRARAAGGEHDSIRLARNAKGDTQIEVVVRTGDSEDIPTIEAAAAKAQEVYDFLGRMYPMSVVEAPAPKGAKAGD
jgi:hypothetical protein